MGIYATFHTTTLKNDFKKATIYEYMIIGFTFLLTAFLANILYFSVLAKNKSFVVSALIYTSPIFTLILAWWVLKEDINIYGLIGVLFIVTGIILISYNT